jgi:hypothetical protein
MERLWQKLETFLKKAKERMGPKQQVTVSEFWNL